MAKKYIIPKHVLTFPEGSYPEDIDISNGMEYEAKKGQRINVRHWVRFPAYDFLFGVPEKDNKAHKLEISYMEFRDTRTKRKINLYLDVEETKEIIEGLSKCLEFSKEHSQHLWLKQ